MTTRTEREPAQRSEVRWRAGWLLIVLVAVALLAVTLWLLHSRISPELATSNVISATTAAEPLRGCVLYYGRRDAGGLVAATRFLPWEDEIEADARTLIAGLGGQPAGAGVSPWPAETVVQDLFVSPSGVLYVNFGSSLRWRCPRGDWMEWLVAATLTRTLCDNLPGITGVRIMIDGESTGTLVRTVPLDEVLRPAMFAAAD